jgi:ABC-type amino acid transport substrate-binding protein
VVVGGDHERGYPDLGAALADLAEGNLDAVVYDAPILLWQVKRDHPGDILVLPRTFDRQDYGIVMPREGSRNEAVNRELLDIIRSSGWEQVLDRYLGES